MNSITLYSPEGIPTTIALEGNSAQEIHRSRLAKQREFGALGYTHALLPDSLVMPLDNHADFDWSMIGAREGTKKFPDGEREGVWWRNDFYSKRDLPANEKKKMAAAVKYSRGGRESDPEHLKEKGSGEDSYVTLVIFRGREGFKLRDYAKPARNEAPRPTGQAKPAPSAPAAPAKKEEELVFQQDPTFEQLVELGARIFPSLQGEALQTRVLQAAEKINNAKFDRPEELELKKLAIGRTYSAFFDQLNTPKAQ